MRYGPGEFEAQIRWAFLDGSPTRLFIDNQDRWDYVGCWAPDGERFFFSSFPDQEGATCLIYHLSTGETQPFVNDEGSGSLPRWSRDGTVMVWEQARTEEQMWIMEGIR